MTVTEAARNFADVVNRSFSCGESTILFRSGEPAARISPVGGVGMRGTELAERWKEMRHLDAEDAADFANTVAEARSRLSVPKSKWD